MTVTEYPCNLAYDMVQLDNKIHSHVHSGSMSWSILSPTDIVARLYSAGNQTYSSIAAWRKWKRMQGQNGGYRSLC